MYERLLDHLARPNRYARTATPFWDDDHISAQMLSAHLDPDSDGASRRPEFMDRSAQWIASLVPAGATVLDIGCGPGLYGRRFSDLGLHVRGIDISRRSIAYATAHDPRGDYRVQDYLTLDLDHCVDLVSLIFCDFGALTPPERRSVLDRIRQALVPGGLFVVDAFSDVWFDQRTGARTWTRYPDGGFFSAAPHLQLSAEYCYDGGVTSDRHVIVEQDDIRDYTLWNTSFTEASLLDEASAADFSTVGVFDDAAGTEFSGAAETICAVLRA